MAQTQKRILFVCTGDNCRTILARAAALKNEGPESRFIFETASCSTESKKFVAEPKVHQSVLNAIKKKCPEEYRLIKDYVPRPLSKEMVSKMDRVYFLCSACMDTAKELIPREYHDRMQFYCTYKSRINSRELHEVPNPINGNNWRDYYDRDRTTEVETDSVTLLESMISQLHPALKTNDLSKL
uniref:Phosphotyrosine protein phosphatase I domain-containing protein n=1 Tax=Amphimedon queenslandica TaxID=400682 RepID=A0A1X7VN54_AMPQE